MSALGEARRLFGQGRQADAVACVEAAGAKGDGEALLAICPISAGQRMVLANGSR